MIEANSLTETIVNNYEGPSLTPRLRDSASEEVLR